MDGSQASYDIKAVNYKTGHNLWYEVTEKNLDWIHGCRSNEAYHLEPDRYVQWLLLFQYIGTCMYTFVSASFWEMNGSAIH